MEMGRGQGQRNGCCTTVSYIRVAQQLNTNLQSYFKTAAQLGDMDAQQDLAFCLANGRGCKKDKKEAAKWYRAAVSRFFVPLPYLLTPLFRLRKALAPLVLLGYTSPSTWINSCFRIMDTHGP